MAGAVIWLSQFAPKRLSQKRRWEGRDRIHLLLYYTSHGHNVAKTGLGVPHDSELFRESRQRNLKGPQNLTIQIRLAPASALREISKLLIFVSKPQLQERGVELDWIWKHCEAGLICCRGATEKTSPTSRLALTIHRNQKSPGRKNSESTLTNSHLRHKLICIENRAVEQFAGLDPRNLSPEIVGAAPVRGQPTACLGQGTEPPSRPSLDRCAFKLL